jgi:hypothetical protein
MYYVLPYVFRCTEVGTCQLGRVFLVLLGVPSGVRILTFSP